MARFVFALACALAVLGASAVELDFVPAPAPSLSGLGLTEAPVTAPVSRAAPLAAPVKAATSAPTADCASLLAGLASTCQSGLALSTNTNLKGADNATLAMAVAQTSVPASCCNSFQTFLDGACRCSPTTAALLSANSISVAGLATITDGTALACSAQHQITLLDPLYNVNCSSAATS